MTDTQKHATTIYLLRHAHAAWARPGQRDFDRSLDQRGVDDARLIAAAFAQFDRLPAVVLCSSARRCQQTCDIILSHLPHAPEVRRTAELYHNDYDYYLELLGLQTSEPILLVGHNPMMDDTARALCTTAAEWPGERLYKGFPTAGLATVDIHQPGAVLISNGHLADFITPKRLRKQTGNSAEDDRH